MARNAARCHPKALPDMSRVAAVIVSFQPSGALAEQVRALTGQVRHVIVVDNGSHEAHRPALAGLAAEVIWVGQNVGVGAAHNIGIRRALELAATHVLLMDQDSLPEPDMVSRLLRAERELMHAERELGAVGPVYHDPRLAKSWPFFRMHRYGVRAHACAEERYVRCDFLISSGTLIRSGVLERIGLMNEEYFIEHVDTEWSLRARFAGYALYGVCDARMNHHLGDTTVAVPFSARRVQLYRPYRHYYLFRNSVLLWRERYAPLAWKINEARRLLYRLVFFGIFVRPRLQRIKFMLLGLWHGLRGRSGPLNA
jgi:rhamnosyltransferase